jgi:hypothetical protein
MSTSVVLDVESLTGTGNSELSTGVAVSEGPCSQSSLAGPTLLEITSLVADMAGVADEMNAHTNVESLRCGLPDEEVVVVDAAPLVTLPWRVPLPAAAAASMG